MYILLVIYPKSPKNASKATFVMSTFSCIFCTSHPFFSPASSLHHPVPVAISTTLPRPVRWVLQLSADRRQKGLQLHHWGGRQQRRPGHRDSHPRVTENGGKIRRCSPWKRGGNVWKRGIKQWNIGDLCVTIANLAYKSSSNCWVWSRFIELVDGVYISWMREWKKT